ncbi:hypothetical protein OUZ56_014007 [Daphnia magna]|uniref:Uncharacterized protein n=1 Tax=Daphnia magna TaxID=35525 RepID=A0ABQ9Z7L5_9CRUS|nr:hypothetical protein OUZ56_014007 [Daphnia magna]
MADIMFDVNQQITEEREPPGAVVMVEEAARLPCRIENRSCHQDKGGHSFTTLTTRPGATSYNPGP